VALRMAQPALELAPSISTLYTSLSLAFSCRSSSSTSDLRMASSLQHQALEPPPSKLTHESRDARGPRVRVWCFKSKSCCSGFRLSASCVPLSSLSAFGFRLSALRFSSSLSAFGFRLWALRFSLHFRELGRRSCAPLSWPRPCSQPPSASRLPVFGVWARVSVSGFGFRILRRD
jgi:hypothetical protein